MVSTRDRKKRAASPVKDTAKPERQARGRKQAAVPAVISDDDDELAQQQPPPKKKKTKATAKPKDSPGSDEADEENHDASAKSAFKTKSKYDKADTAMASGQHAKSDRLVIPVDEACPLSSWRVYIDEDDGIIYDASLNQTNSSGNNNKFYKLQILTDGQQFCTWTRWGRVGNTGQSARLGNGSLDSAMKEFEKKFKDKTTLTWENRGNPPKAGKYVFLEKSYEPDTSEDEEDDETQAGASDQKSARSRSSSPVKCSLAPPVKSLMELIFNQEYMDSVMADMNYDVNKMPLGKLSKPTITRGYQALKDLAALFDDPSLAERQHGMESTADATEYLSNLYYSYIPHDFGRAHPPIISNHQRLKREVELLESLTDLKDADAIIKAGKKNISTVHPLDARFQGLGLQETTPVDRSTDEFAHISDYLINSRGATHGHEYELLDVFRIERQNETERYEKKFGKKTASDRRLLWHGSRSTNFGGILSQGLRIAPPEAPVSGYAFGKGIYLADMASKSANYCMSFQSDGHALLLLCEAELGSPMQTLTSGSFYAGDDALAKGLLSTWGQGTTGPKAWMDASCVHPSLKGVKMPDTVTKPPGDIDIQGGYLQYNEYIVYDVDQVRLRYLLRVKM